MVIKRVSIREDFLKERCKASESSNGKMVLDMKAIILIISNTAKEST